MKKKLTLIVSAVALGALLAVGGTLAWFTDTETATNVVTMGNVNVAIHEVGPDGENKVIGEDGFTGLGFETMTPGANLDKDVTVANTGANDAYIRAKITFENMPVGVKDSLVLVTPEDTKWTLKDGYYYYNGILEAGTTTTSLITDVQIPTTWGNEAADAEGIKIIVNVEAVQSDNLNVDNANAAFAVDGVEMETAAAPVVPTT